MMQAMSRPDGLLHPEPLPVEHILFDSPLARIGTFRCRPEHPLFRDSGPIVNPVFVFPRTAVWIEHDGRTPFLSDPTAATLYNRGQRYRRRPLSERGDRCEWFALAPHVLDEIASVRDAAAVERPEWPFTTPQIPVDRRVYLAQRRLVESLAGEDPPDSLLVEESVVWLATRILDTAGDRAGLPGAPRHSARVLRRQADLAVQTREMLARRFDQPASLEMLARHVGVSAFHLCRLFHRHTGMTLHEYRTELRLRDALDRLTSRRGDLTRIALDLGFSSHSHFTAAFRRAFGMTPSTFVRQARPPAG
jgi:AraC family transcriptional regulator